jgi:hypothetical protein
MMGYVCSLAMNSLAIVQTSRNDVSLPVSVQFPLTSLRELRVLKLLRHPNIVQLFDVAVGKDRDR